MESISAMVIEDVLDTDNCLTTRLKNLDNLKMLFSGEEEICSVTAVLNNQPDVLFVDMQMLGTHVLGLLKELSKAMEALPKIVFLADSSDFAMQAFEHNAFDYLIKPVSDGRLTTCLDRLRNAVLENQALLAQSKLNQLLCTKTGKSLDGFMQCLEHSKQANITDLQQTISIKSGTQWLRIKLECILWIQAAGDYMCIHTEDETHIVRKTLRQFEVELDKTCFPRINRSTIINLSRITHLTPNSNGEYIARLDSGVELKVSRRYKLKMGRELKTTL
ncbi:LytR/AlgR family response regulator transcription factor [Aliiglaciecola sp. SL4]|uniref:LytR/AlgR family response regulator transcription factor n=1 Tax=Aliiglaciecola sp. SL4 TaxID=3239806 RepID=UPI00355B9CE3